MAVSAARVTAGAAAVALNPVSASGTTLVVQNVDTTDAAELGPAGVTAGTGYPLAPNAVVQVDLDPGDQLFAVRSAAADVDLAVLRT